MGEFSVVINGDRLPSGGKSTEDTATVQVQIIGRDFIKDAAADLVHFSHVSAKGPIAVSLPHTLNLYTDAAAGGGDSTSGLGYRISVSTAYGSGGTVEINAKPDTTSWSYADLVSDWTGAPVPEDIAVRAENAAADAAASAASIDPATIVRKIAPATGVDDTATLQAAINTLKAFAVTDPPLSRPIVLDGQGGTYRITGSLDLTGITLGRGWEIRNLHIAAACPGKIAVDLAASRFGKLSNVHIWGDQTSQPHTGLGMSNATDGPCGNMALDNVTVDGYFTSSAFHNNASEVNYYSHCSFWNRRVADVSGDAYAVILDGAGYKSYPSDFTIPTTTRQSFTVNKFDQCTIQKPFGIAGPTMFLQDVASLSFESCYLTAGSGSAIEWRLTDGFTPYRVYMDFQCETTGLDRFIEWVSDGVTGVHEIRGLECTFGNMFTDQELYGLDASVVSLALRSLKSHVYRWASGVTLAGDLFSSPGKVSIYGGDIVVPAASDLNVPAAFARFDASVLTMDGSAVNWTYVPVLSNWTLGNGVITGEYRKVGRQVHYEIRYVVGSTDTPAGNFVVSLPMPADGGSAGKPRGQAHLFDSSANIHKMRWATHATSSTLNLVDVDYGLVGALNPFTFAAGDVIDISGTYEAAS